MCPYLVTWPNTLIWLAFTYLINDIQNNVNRQKIPTFDTQIKTLFMLSSPNTKSMMLIRDK